MQVNSVLHPSAGSLNRVPASAAGWQVILCDPVGHLISRLRTAIYTLLIHFSSLRKLFTLYVAHYDKISKCYLSFSSSFILLCNRHKTKITPSRNIPEWKRYNSYCTTKFTRQSTCLAIGLLDYRTYQFVWCTQDTTETKSRFGGKWPLLGKISQFFSERTDEHIDSWHFGGTVSLMNKFVFFWAILAALWPLQLDVRHHIQWRRRLVNAY